MHPGARASILLCATVAAAATAAAGGALAAGPGLGVEQAGEIARDLMARFHDWVVAGYARRPAVMVGLAGVLVLPLLLVIGAVLCRKPARPEPADAPALADNAGLRGARLVLDGARPIVLPPGRDLLQIGRLEDNDICIADEHVESYHAVIEWLDEAGFTITDVSGPQSKGVKVNGERCLSAVLTDGDMVELGSTRMRFAAAA